MSHTDEHDTGPVSIPVIDDDDDDDDDDDGMERIAKRSFRYDHFGC